MFTATLQVIETGGIKAIVKIWERKTSVKFMQEEQHKPIEMLQSKPEENPKRNLRNY